MFLVSPSDGEAEESDDEEGKMKCVRCGGGGGVVFPREKVIGERSKLWGAIPLNAVERKRSNYLLRMGDTRRC